MSGGPRAPKDRNPFVEPDAVMAKAAAGVAGMIPGWHEREDISLRLQVLPHAVDAFRAATIDVAFIDAFDAIYQYVKTGKKPEKT